MEYSVGMLLTIAKNKRDKAEFSAESLSLHGLEAFENAHNAQVPESRAENVSSVAHFSVINHEVAKNHNMSSSFSENRFHS